MIGRIPVWLSISGLRLCCAVMPANRCSKSGPSITRPNHLFQRPIHPELAKNEIDCFIQAELARANLQPSPEADNRTLLRRVYFDVTGLPRLQKWNSSH